MSTSDPEDRSTVEATSEARARPAGDAAELVLPAPDLDATLAFFTDELGFRVESIFPADAPRQVVVTGHGVRLRLERDAALPSGADALPMLPTLIIHADLVEAHETIAPNGLRIRFEPAEPPLILPPLAPSLVVSRAGRGSDDDTVWSTGRAGMQYRDLIPNRQGGRFIASHIRIPVGGPVPDYVHEHTVAFQVIFCRRGRVRVVYEDQGPPFWMEAGDCVLQPPRIRHRVLECTDGLEVVEVTCPAEHLTRADPALELPTGELQPERDFGGQRFVLRRAADAGWAPWRSGDFEFRDTGIGRATHGLADVRVMRPARPASPGSPTASEAPLVQHGGEMLLLFALEGSVRVRTESRGEVTLGPGDSIQLPPDEPYGLSAPSDALELLAVEVHAVSD